MKTELVCKVKISMSANDWELYQIKGVNVAAKALSMAATKAINEAHKVYALTHSQHEANHTAWAIWYPTSRKFSDFGACDSEPCWYFQDLMNRFFHKPHGLSY